ncbi:MAG: Hsp20/alpha crystallin family protein, partial [Pseudomonadota bacterium]
KAYAGVKMRAAGMDVSPATAAKPDEAASPDPANTTLTETSAAWIITADIPGASHQDVHLSRDETVLSIITRGPRHYSAHIDIGARFDLDDIAIALARGVLTLEIPKGGSA